MPLRDKLPENCILYYGLSRIFLLREALHESRTQIYFSQRTVATGNFTAQCITPPQRFSQFYGNFNKGAYVHFSSFVPGSFARHAFSTPEPTFHRVSGFEDEGLLETLCCRSQNLAIWPSLLHAHTK